MAETIDFTDRRAEFMRGTRRAWPIVFAVTPFGLLFGALSVANGLSVGETVLMSGAIFAGASQLVGIELFGQKIAPWIVVFSVFAVNFRHILYSAVTGRSTRHWPVGLRYFAFFFLTDPQFAEAERRVTEGKKLTLAWYFGLASVLYVCWLISALMGAVFGTLVPDPYAFGLDFFAPIYFFGLVMEFRGRASWLPVVAASAAASTLAYHAVGSPWHVSIGALAGMALAVVLPPKPRGGEERA